MKTRAVKPIRHKTPYRHTEGTLYCYQSKNIRRLMDAMKSEIKRKSV